MDRALETQLANIQKRTGKSLDELTAIVRNSGLAKHGEIVAMLKDKLGMGHGDANTIVHLAKGNIADTTVTTGTAGSSGSAAVIDTEVERIYAGPKAALRPIHDNVMDAVSKFGAFEIAPKKTYLSLRRKKQFAMVGPATNSRVEVSLNIKTEVGLNMKGGTGTKRLEALPPGGMCQYRVKLTAAADVDAELIGWIRQAYDAAE